MKIKSHNQAKAEADLTPMIDMVFQLIAFFMVLINFSQSEQNDRVQLPDSQLAKPAEDKLEFPIVIHLTSEGTVIVGGDETGVEGIRPLLGRELEVLRLEKKTAADANIVIRGHRDVAGGRVQDLIEKCQAMGFEKFALRVKEEPR
ncbi:MAG: biopolymer transporter ExbD [Planctomycetaceae bacterium]|jgi:biopolymer transport protein ExbD|nr:biopolymer transporter ExbD [Planctomycetaceae bacterium]MBN8602341.1 biopolymer transporter ExbD [Planctomycetota bacterium]